MAFETGGGYTFIINLEENNTPVNLDLNFSIQFKYSNITNTIYFFRNQIIIL